jgi:hypothetical protein
MKLKSREASAASTPIIRQTKATHKPAMILLLFIFIKKNSFSTTARLGTM